MVRGTVIYTNSRPLRPLRYHGKSNSLFLLSPERCFVPVREAIGENRAFTLPDIDRSRRLTSLATHPFIQICNVCISDRMICVRPEHLGVQSDIKEVLAAESYFLMARHQEGWKRECWKTLADLIGESGSTVHLALSMHQD
jgi:hypothetical protein